MADATLEIIKIVLSVIAGVYIFIVGITNYSQSIKIKRAEFLDKLIAEFLNQETEIARNLLDDYVYVKKGNRDKTALEQKELAVPLIKYLRDHKQDPIGADDEIAVRKSFDKLLDFLSKLSYYLKQNLISKSELGYFKYYLVKIEEKKEVLDYIDVYFYRKDFEILFNAIR